MQSFLSFSAVIFLLLLIDKLSDIVSCQKYDNTVGFTKFLEFVHLDCDFENGKIDPWIEQSEFSVQWQIENNISPWEPENAAPSPLNGPNYLRVNRGTTLSFGVAVLRSPTFILTDSNEVFFSFSFWIRSKWPQFTNLELYLAKNGNEGLLLNLSEYSSISNRVWQSQTVSITDDLFSNLTLVFYAYCGTDIEDAVAIDNLRLFSLQQSTSTTATSSLTAKTASSTTSIFPTLSSSSYETESSTSPSTSLTYTTTLSTSFTFTKPPTTSTPSTLSSNHFDTTDPITSTVTEPSMSTTTTTSSTPSTTISDPTTTPEEKTTKEQSTKSTDITDAVTTTVNDMSTTTPVEGDCPFYLQDDSKVPCWILGGKCYCFYTNSIGMVWLTADSYCKEEDMTLLSLETEEENRLIYDHIKFTPELDLINYWTSGRYSNESQCWEWASIEPSEPFTYEYWTPGKPINTEPGCCVYLDVFWSYNAGCWTDAFCLNSYQFICESMN